MFIALKSTAKFMNQDQLPLAPFSALAVVGGTHFDSAKGAIYLKGRGINAIPLAISDQPIEDEAIYRDPSIVRRTFFERKGERSFSEIAVYCNSLSFITNWHEIYPGQTAELTVYYETILKEADLNNLAIIVSEEFTRDNLKDWAAREKICDPSALQIYPELELIKKLERSDEEKQFTLLNQTLNRFRDLGYGEILLGCTHLDHPSFNEVADLRIYQPGLLMLEDLVSEYDQYRTALRRSDLERIDPPQ